MSKYNELVVDKTLLKKLSTVKTTINNNNDFFVKQLNSKTYLIFINFALKTYIKNLINPLNPKPFHICLPLKFLLFT